VYIIETGTTLEQVSESLSRIKLVAFALACRSQQFGRYKSRNRSRKLKLHRANRVIGRSDLGANRLSHREGLSSLSAIFRPAKRDESKRKDLCIPPPLLPRIASQAAFAWAPAYRRGDTWLLRREPFAQRRIPLSLRITSIVVPEMVKLCFLQADPLLNVPLAWINFAAGC